MTEMEDVVAAYDLGIVKSTEKLRGGIVNQSQKVVTSKGTFVIQQLSSMFTPAVIHDYCAVQRFLRTNGLQVPVLLHTKDNGPYVLKDGRIWRAFEYIPNDAVTMSPEIALEAGKMLGKFHKIMEHSDFVPSHALPGFHDFAGYVRAFESKVPTAENQQEHAFLEEFLPLYAGQQTHDDDMLLHGDPKLANMLFKDGKAVALLDLDTMMFGSKLIDLGDAFRSWCKPFGKFEQSIFDAARAGYMVENPSCAIIQDTEKLKGAMRKITLELATRFFIDYYDQSYFSWDATKYKNAAEHNLVRCRECIQYFKSML